MKRIFNDDTEHEVKTLEVISDGCKAIFRGSYNYINELWHILDSVDLEMVSQILTVPEEQDIRVDSIKEFINNCIEIDVANYERQELVYGEYIRFCEDNNYKVSNKTVFHKEMQKLNSVRPSLRKYDGESVRVYNGIRLITELEEYHEEENDIGKATEIESEIEQKQVIDTGKPTEIEIVAGKLHSISAREELKTVLQNEYYKYLTTQSSLNEATIKNYVKAIASENRSDVAYRPALPYWIDFTEKLQHEIQNKYKSLTGNEYENLIKLLREEHQERMKEFQKQEGKYYRAKLYEIKPDILSSIKEISLYLARGTHFDNIAVKTDYKKVHITGCVDLLNQISKKLLVKIDEERYRFKHNARFYLIIGTINNLKSDNAYSSYHNEMIKEDHDRFYGCMINDKRISVEEADVYLQKIKQGHDDGTEEYHEARKLWDEFIEEESIKIIDELKKYNLEEQKVKKDLCSR